MLCRQDVAQFVARSCAVRAAEARTRRAERPDELQLELERPVRRMRKSSEWPAQALEQPQPPAAGGAQPRGAEAQPQRALPVTQVGLVRQAFQPQV